MFPPLYITNMHYVRTTYIIVHTITYTRNTYMAAGSPRQSLRVNQPDFYRVRCADPSRRVVGFDSRRNCATRTFRKMDLAFPFRPRSEITRDERAVSTLQLHYSWARGSWDGGWICLLHLCFTCDKTLSLSLSILYIIQYIANNAIGKSYIFRLRCNEILIKRAKHQRISRYNGN